MLLTKLDAYDYLLLPGIIRVELEATNDPVIVDILSEIENSNGNIYVEREYYSFLDVYDIFKENGKTYMDLQVIKTA